MNHTERQALAKVAEHRICCPACSNSDHMIKYGWCITGKRLWRYYMSIKLTPKAGTR